MPENVIELITSDHREMERIFEQLKSDKQRRGELVHTLAAMLTAHSRAEEERVYPQLVRADPQEKEGVFHGAQEHAEAEQILQQLLLADTGSAEFDQTLRQLVDAVTHHVEEEESEILPALAEAVDQRRLTELGRAFAERRQQELDRYPAHSGGATKEELYEQARKQDVPGRSTMTKDELAEAVRGTKA